MKFNTKEKQGGELLIGAMLGITIITMFIFTALIPMWENSKANRLIFSVKEETSNIAQAAQLFRVRTRVGTSGATRWPLSVDELISVGYLPYNKNLNPYGHPYRIETTGEDILIITADMDTPKNAASLVALLGNLTADYSENEVYIAILRPGDEAAHEQFLLVDGTRAMTGSLNLGGNNIERARNVNSSNVIATGDVISNNILAIRDVVVRGDVTSVNVVASRNVIVRDSVIAGGDVTSRNNVIARGNVTATGDITSRNVTATGDVTSLNVTSRNVTSTGDISGNTATFNDLRVR